MELIDSRLQWTTREYGEHDKIATKLTTTPAAKDMDTKNINDWLRTFITIVDVHNGATINLTHLCPNDTDQTLLDIECRDHWTQTHRS
jgi:hypothetical protein